MKKLFLHIGAPKTGTSAIQDFMLRNRKALASQGVLYPAGGMLKSAHHLIGAAIHPQRAKRLGATPRDEALQTAVSQINEEVAACAPHTLVISTEYLWGKLSADNIRRLLTPFSDWDIHVVVYLRRQDLLAQSLYIQAVKTGSAQSFAEWVNTAVDSGKAGFFFHSVLACWRDCGLPVSVIVRIYEKSDIGSDVCADFLQTLGGAPLQGLVNDRRSINTAPDMATTELLRFVNARLLGSDAAEQVRRSIVKHSPPRELFAPLRYIGSAQLIEFMARFEDDNRRVAHEFADRPDGVLFREPLPSDSIADPAHFDTTTLLNKLIELLPILTQARPTAANSRGNEPAAEATPQDRPKKKKQKNRQLKPQIAG